MIAEEQETVIGAEPSADARRLFREAGNHQRELVRAHSRFTDALHIAREQQRLLADGDAIQTWLDSVVSGLEALTDTDLLAGTHWARLQLQEAKQSAGSLRRVLLLKCVRAKAAAEAAQATACELGIALQRLDELDVACEDLQAIVGKPVED